MIVMNTDEFKQHVMEDKPVLVEFWAPWCVYCRRIAPALGKVAQEQEGKIVVGQINIDEEPDLAAQEGIKVIPTLVVYHCGERLGSITAPESKARIEEFLLDTIGE